MSTLPTRIEREAGRRLEAGEIVNITAARDSMPEGQEHGQVHRLTRILFCTDFSKNSETALKYALSATEEYDAELTLLHVLEEAPEPG